MPATVTVTGSIAAGQALTSAVFPDVLKFSVDTNTNVLTLEFEQNRVVFISVSAATTVASTKSGTTWTLSIT